MADNIVVNLPTVPGGKTVRTVDNGSGVQVSIGGVSDVSGTTVAAVKAASTAPQTTDPALVVAISPNASVAVTGDVTATPATSSTGTASSVDASITSVALLASNPSRKGGTIYSDSTATLYVGLGSSASTTAFAVVLNEGDYYELPAHYTGPVSGVWASATGAARLVELA